MKALTHVFLGLASLMLVLSLSEGESLATKGQSIYSYIYYAGSGAASEEIKQVSETGGRVRFVYHYEHSSGATGVTTSKKTLGKGCRPWKLAPAECSHGAGNSESDDARCTRQSKRFAKDLRDHLGSCKKVVNSLTFDEGFIIQPRR